MKKLQNTKVYKTVMCSFLLKLAYFIKGNIVMPSAK